MTGSEPSEEEQKNLIATATAIFIAGLLLVVLSSGWFAFHLYRELQKFYS